MSDNTAITPALSNETTRADSITGSPVSSSGGPLRQRQKQIAIARNAESGYTRPERARTSHACEPCRERKTKCDGERPACRRCQNTHTQCHYGYGKGWKKRKPLRTVEDLNITSWKLAKYESLFDQIHPLVSSDVRLLIDDARQQEYIPAPNMDTTDPNAIMQVYRTEGSYTATSPDLTRISTNQSLPNTQPATIYPDPRMLPTPLPMSPSMKAPVGQQVSRISPSDDIGGSPVVRLPSITRQGVLLEGTLPIAPGLAQGKTDPDLEQQRVNSAGELTNSRMLTADE